MGENGQSGLLAPALLLLLLFTAGILASTRSPRHADIKARTKLVEIFLLGIACQCAHAIEEFVGGLHVRYPVLLGLSPLSAETFVGFNVFWLGIWSLAAYGVLRGVTIAYFPVWFFGLAMCLNGIIHPLLAVWAGGYFPGLVTSPVAGIVGFLSTRRLLHLTGARSNLE